MPEAVVIAALVEGVTYSHNLLRSWCNPCCKLCGVESLLLLPQYSTKGASVELLWWLRCTKHAELLLVLLLWLLRCTKDAWLALLLSKPAATVGVCAAQL